MGLGFDELHGDTAPLWVDALGGNAGIERMGIGREGECCIACGIGIGGNALDISLLVYDVTADHFFAVSTSTETNGIVMFFKMNKKNTITPETATKSTIFLGNCRIRGGCLNLQLACLVGITHKHSPTATVVAAIGCCLRTVNK